METLGGDVGLGQPRCDRAACSLPTLFMTVRREIGEPRRETGAQRPEDLRRTRAVR
jgi:hypothetical protein